MAAPTTLNGKTRKGVLVIFGYVASEGDAVANHAKRIEVCRQFLSGSGLCWTFLVETLTLVNDYGDATPQADIENVISACITNAVAGGLV